MNSTQKDMSHKIAIDTGPLSSGHATRGIGAHTRELISALGSSVTPVDFSNSKLTGYDILHYTSFNPFFLSLPLVKPKGIKIVLTIHDLITLIYPDHYPPGLRGKVKFLLNKYLVRKHVDAIITISETSKKDICRFLGVAPEIVHVVYLAPRKIFKPLLPNSLKGTREKYNLPDTFALYVGDVNYNKNIPSLIEMCKVAGIKLVIIGKQADGIENTNLDHAELAHLKAVDWSTVTRLGFVDESDLVAVYNLATVYIQPSLYEGFALPILEAHACGTPVIASRIQAHVEVAGEVIDMGKKLPRDYSWEKVAVETIRVYKSLLR